MDLTYKSIDNIVNISRRFDNEYVKNNFNSASNLNKLFNTELKKLSGGSNNNFLNLSSDLNELQQINDLLMITKIGGNNTNIKETKSIKESDDDLKKELNNCKSAKVCVLLFVKSTCPYCVRAKSVWKQIENELINKPDYNSYVVKLTSSNNDTIVENRPIGDSIRLNLQQNGLNLPHVPSIVVIKKNGNDHNYTEYPENVRTENFENIMNFITK